MITVRSATLQDASEISDLICPLAEKFIASEFPPSGRNALLGSLSSSAIEGYLQQGYRYHLAVEEKRLVGVVGVRDNSHLYHLFIAEEFQHRGIGRMLWTHASSECRSAGYDGPFTVCASRLSVGFYERIGFITAGPPETRNDVTGYPMVTRQEQP